MTAPELVLGREELVTDEMVLGACAQYDEHSTDLDVIAYPKAMRAALTAVADNLACAGEERARRAGSRLASALNADHQDAEPDCPSCHHPWADHRPTGCTADDGLYDRTCWCQTTGPAPTGRPPVCAAGCQLARMVAAPGREDLGRDLGRLLASVDPDADVFDWHRCAGCRLADQPCPCAGETFAAAAVVDHVAALLRAGEERARRECADELRVWADEHAGRKDFTDEDGNRDHVDRYASRESLHRFADQWAAPGQTEGERE